MRRTIASFVFMIALLSSAGASAQAPGAANAPAITPSVLVELFSSEGCSSCPEADDFGQELLRLADSTNSPVYVIDYHVGIWNNKEWTDSFATPEFTKRQSTYMEKAGQKALFTPMMFINGQYGMPGGDKKNVGRAIFKELVTPGKVGLSINANMLNNGKGLAISYNLTNRIDSAQLVLVFAEKEVTSNVTGGENKGKVLKHHNIARQVYTIPVTNELSGVYQIPMEKGMDMENYILVGMVQHTRSWQVFATDQLFFSKRL